MNHTVSYEEIRKAMREKGITQSELARKLGVSQASISDVLCGRSASSGKLGRALLAELELTPRQDPPAAPRCPFMSSFPVRMAVSGQSLAKLLAEALMIAVIANLITK